MPEVLQGQGPRNISIVFCMCDLVANRMFSLLEIRTKKKKIRSRTGQSSMLVTGQVSISKASLQPFILPGRKHLLSAFSVLKVVL